MFYLDEYICIRKEEKEVFFSSSGNKMFYNNIKFISIKKFFLKGGQQTTGIEKIYKFAYCY